MRVVIAGAGIGGLAAAAALRRRGHEVQVLERAPELLPLGAGLTMQPNALRALDAIDPDLAAAVRAKGSPIAGKIRHWRGRVLVDASADRLADIAGELPVGIHRADLQLLLLEAVGRSRVRLGSEVRGFEDGGSGITVHLDEGAAVSGDVLIGADGIRSAVRRQLRGDEPLRYAGYTCWRGVCEAGDGVLAEVSGGETWGPGSRFGSVPVGSGRVYWFAVVNAPEGGVDEGDPKDAVRAHFGAFHDPIPALIEATPTSAIFRNDIHDRPPVEHWGEGRVTLLGDAAHAMTPNLGQGACQAVEDAAVLAALLPVDGDPAPGLRQYESRRIPRANRFVREGFKLGRVGQLDNGLARGLRDLAVRLQPSDVAVRSMRWMFWE